MFDLTTLRERRTDDESGFTLIELLVVVVIIGILIGIATPVYLNYTHSAADKSALSDLRNTITTLEQCMTDNGSYPKGNIGLGNEGWEDGNCTAKPTLSNGTQLRYIPIDGLNYYDLVAYNTNGNTSEGKFYCYSSLQGGGVSNTTYSGMRKEFVKSCDELSATDKMARARVAR